MMVDELYNIPMNNHENMLLFHTEYLKLALINFYNKVFCIKQKTMDIGSIYIKKKVSCIISERLNKGP